MGQPPFLRRGGRRLPLSSPPLVSFPAATPAVGATLPHVSPLIEQSPAALHLIILTSAAPTVRPFARMTYSTGCSSIVIRLMIGAVIVLRPPTNTTHEQPDRPSDLRISMTRVQ